MATKRKAGLADDLDLGVDLDAARAAPGSAAAPPFLGAAPVAPQSLSREPVAKAATTPGTVKASAVNMSLYLAPADHRRLRLLAAAEGTSIQSLLLDGLDHVLAARDEAPVTRWPARRRR